MKMIQKKKITKPEVCWMCKGKGKAITPPSQWPTKCQRCYGTGKIYD